MSSQTTLPNEKRADEGASSAPPRCARACGDLTCALALSRASQVPVSLGCPRRASGRGGRGLMSAAGNHPASGLARLRIELVPSTCWLSNVRSLMKKRAWQRLAAEVAEHGRRCCEVCGGRGRQHAVECHEVWFYDERRGVQLLMRLQALCPRCHRAKHLGRTASLGYGEQACAWLAHVNGWDQATTERYVDAVFSQWAARSQRAWTLDLTVLGEAYQVGLDDLGLDSYVLAPRERERMQHRRAVSMEDVYQRDGRSAR
jgi:hypothetical protein